MPRLLFLSTFCLVVVSTQAQSSCDLDYMGDGYCDAINNSAECNWDDGDCCNQDEDKNCPKCVDPEWQGDG